MRTGTWRIANKMLHIPGVGYSTNGRESSSLLYVEVCLARRTANASLERKSSVENISSLLPLTTIYVAVPVGVSLGASSGGAQL